MRGFVLVIIFALEGWGARAWAAAGGVEVLNYSARPETTNNFAEASFSCVVPARKARAILFLAGGTDADARPWLADSRWRALAEKEDLVLIAACLRGAGEPYEMAERGSGQALLEAIEEFGRSGDCPEMPRLPLILYGHSAGSQFAFRFACWKPERVRAIIGMKSGPLAAPVFREAPPFRGLFVVGERDLPGRVREVARTFAAGRSKGAPWCLACQPDAGHGTDGCRDLVEAFIQAIQAVPAPPGQYARLADLEGDASVGGATDPNDNWLPDSTFDKAWRGFAKPVKLAEMLSLADEPAEIGMAWRPVVAIPERLEVGEPRARFEYLLSVPEDAPAISEATVRASSPAVRVTVTRRAKREWCVAGECDLSSAPLGPFKGELNVELVTAAGVHLRDQRTLFTQLLGPVAIQPSSLYYGVVARETTAEFRLVIRPRANHVIESCEAVSSDAKFMDVTVSPAETPGEYVAKCTVRAGSWVGAKNGGLTLRVKAGQEYEIRVPFYGFVKK